MARKEALSVSTLENGRGWTLELTGELDMATAPRIVNMVNTDKPVVIDLSGLTFLDSSGLSALLKVQGSCECLRLVPGPPVVQRVFEVTKTVDRFEWVAPEERTEGEARPS